ncbi:hypothetical protein CK227_10455 [Mesorhizobium sp. WSM4308]|uniref:hypothetical protein n=1 Tax=Mesorhizobium sp. WSM4308 TaxID=2029409 RepID=UPI000BAEFF34|nr:hypothetical protein [Mesorhizobium sp. WSM4308]PBB75204.1 hypothetical protein CK227_10455 [Mesorhizobium sp. WSM4308]
MSRINATYRAPEGDSPFVEMCGVRFFDGQAMPLDSEEHAELIAKLRTNQHFEVGGKKDKVEAEADADKSDKRAM